MIIGSEQMGAPESGLTWRTFGIAFGLHVALFLFFWIMGIVSFRKPETIIPIDMTIVPPWAQQTDDPEPDPNPPPPEVKQEVKPPPEELSLWTGISSASSPRRAASSITASISPPWRSSSCSAPMNKKTGTVKTSVFAVPVQTEGPLLSQRPEAVYYIYPIFSYCRGARWISLFLMPKWVSL